MLSKVIIIIIIIIIIICGQFTSGKVENITDNEGSSHLNSQVGAEPIIHRVQTSAGKI